MIQLVPPSGLRNVCNPAKLDGPETAEGNHAITGQDRASKALKFGLGMKAGGFNIYVAGTAGTGKLTAVRNFVDELALKHASPFDWCYVNNFKDNYQPLKLRLPSGSALEFKRGIKELIFNALKALLRAFESEDYSEKRKNIMDAFAEFQSDILNNIQEKANSESLMIKQTPWEIITFPSVNGKRLTDKEFNALSPQERDIISKKQDSFLSEIELQLGELRKQEKEVNIKLQKLDKDVAFRCINSLFKESEEKYKPLPDVLAYLKNAKNDILNNLDEFRKLHNSTDENLSKPQSFLKRYEVNVLVDNSNHNGAPVVTEHNPTFNNLLGKVEMESHMGTLRTDFTMIRKGALHSANGGYLILRVEELLQNYYAWDGLKRALKNKEIVIEDVNEQWGGFSQRTLKPEAIPLDVKVILIGLPEHYQLLYLYEPDFKSLFKVKAEFDGEIRRDEKGIADYAQFVYSICRKEGLLIPEKEAIAKIIEYGSRLINDQSKLSASFNQIADIIREANQYALEGGEKCLKAGYITKAVQEKVYRSNLIQQKLGEMVGNRQIAIDVKGAKTGEINGLSVIDIGDLTFGHPNRITCSVSLGKEGVVTIEREAKLSGPIHTKGVLILEGYFAEKYGQNTPITLSARLVFEQSYGEVEGDSASSAELYALLSNLAGLPIKQGIAVTGSINQKGQIQSIGGVNEKIEGFFEVCKQAGLTGEQGVIIPATDIQCLMLREEIVQAVAQKQFTIWAAETVDDGIEILTGVTGGPVEDTGTVANLVASGLNSYSEKMKAFINPAWKEMV